MPFSASELLAAFQRVMPQHEAERLVMDILDGVKAQEKGNVKGYHLPESTLDLLAAGSQELARRVQEYRDDRAQEADRADRRRDEWWRAQSGGLSDPP